MTKEEIVLQDGQPDVTLLTPQEEKNLRLLLEELSYRDIADLLATTLRERGITAEQFYKLSGSCRRTKVGPHFEAQRENVFSTMRSMEKGYCRPTIKLRIIRKKGG